MIPETERISDERITGLIAHISGEPTDQPTNLRSLRADIISALRELVRLRDGWVSVKDRLPRTWSWIVIGGIVQYTPARPDGDVWEFWPEYCEHAVPAEMVTHWMPLPAPPRPFTSQEVYEARICSRCDHSHASHNDGHPHLGCDVPSEQGAPCGCEKFTRIITLTQGGAK